jgi:hypothetical protein
MKKIIATSLVALAFAVSILLPVNSSVKQSFSNRYAPVYAAVVSGSPIPIPNPPGRLEVDSPSGSPIPIPNPPGLKVSSSSGSPIPIPNPPGRIA